MIANNFLENLKTKKYVVLGLVSVPCVIAIAVSACMNSDAGAKTHTVSAEKQNSNTFEVSQKPNERVAKTMTEWSAFAIYHPYSEVSEENVFAAFRKKKEVIQSVEIERKDVSSNPQEQVLLLSGKAIIPIFRATFGDQIRSGSDIERDPWFTTHPSALFTPEQMKALCHNDLQEFAEGSFEMCWKPKMTAQYLATLTDFATDACPQLIGREYKNNIMSANKLMKTKDFREQNLKSFAVNFLKIPQEKVTQEWLEDIAAQARDSLKANLELPTEEQGTTSQQVELEPPDLYILACQAMILSKEFYSR